VDDEAAAAEAGRYAGDDITIRRPTVGRATTTVVIRVATLLFSGVVHAADVTDVKAAEIAFNAAQNAGNIADMAKFFLADRTIFGPGGGGLGVGWTEESLARSRRSSTLGARSTIESRRSKCTSTAEWPSAPSSELARSRRSGACLVPHLSQASRVWQYRRARSTAS